MKNQHQQRSHPADITCMLCRTKLRRSGVTHTAIVYSCLCGATVIPVSRPASGVPARPPDNAA